MRWILVVALVAGLCQGCFVFEELDKGEKLMEQHSPRAREKPEEPKPARAERSSRRTKKTEGTLDALQKWWKKKREPAPPKRDPTDVVVRCKIGGRTQFTRKSDCTLQGGQAI